MRFCQPHWDSLRKAIEEERGLSHLIAANGKEATERMIKEFQGEDGRDTFDPLMSAHYMILSNALGLMGLRIIGEFCPLCELDKLDLDEKSSDWIRSASDSVLEYAKELGLQG